MNLVFIYGPPGVGKLSVARELSKINGYKVFHNHLTYDLVHEIFGERVPWKLVDAIRMSVFKEYCKTAESGLIFTYVYAKKIDDKFVKKIRKLAKDHGFNIYFVQLTCDIEALKTRIALDNRKEFKKLTDPKALLSLLDEYELTSPIPFVIGQTIDNTNIDPVEAAQLISKNITGKR